MRKRTAIMLALAFCSPGSAHLMAASAADRFASLDANKDGKIVMEEFSAAFPSMHRQAFDVIDLNGDKVIDSSEWAEFTSTHGTPARPAHEGAPMNNSPGDPIIPPPDGSDLPLMRPPSQ